MKVNFTIDNSSLIVSITSENISERCKSDLNIYLSNLSEDFRYKNGLFTIPWFELRRGITEVGLILKQNSVISEFDDLLTKLILEIIKEKKSIKEKYIDYEINEAEFKKLLKDSRFERILTPQQERDSLKLLKMKHGANFSVPGAGKTTTILAVHSILKQLQIVNKLFVVSPINAFISWEDEVNEIFQDNNLKIHRILKDNLHNFDSALFQKTDIILINYEKLRKDIKELIPFFITNKIHLILDESHRIKSGSNNLSYNQIIKLGDLAKRRDILSGTPMPQSYNDLVSQFDYLWPGEKVLPDMSNQVSTDETNKYVNESINNLFVRTTKNELGLRNPIIKPVYIKMGPIQKELYNLFKSETARKIANMDRNNLQNFRKIGKSVVKLLQAATNPMLLSLKNYDDDDKSPIPIPTEKEYWELLDEFRTYEKPTKIEYLQNRVKEILEENPHNKVLIWSYFVRNIRILERLFSDYNPVSIHGGILSGSEDDEDKREGRIRIFHQNPSCRIMIANPQACGEGISLHKVCHYAIYLDRNFNAAYFLQSIDRIHRLGLSKEIDTKIEILISEDSIDEILIDRINTKIDTMGKVLSDPYLQYLTYDPQDILPDDDSGIDNIDFELIKQHVNKK